MVKRVQKDNKDFYQCGACSFLYEDKNIVEKCEAWCREHNSCNLEIIKYGIPPSNEGA